jgi:hypothetical protein
MIGSTHLFTISQIYWAHYCKGQVPLQMLVQETPEVCLSSTLISITPWDYHITDLGCNTFWTLWGNQEALPWKLSASKGQARDKPVWLCRLESFLKGVFPASETSVLAKEPEVGEGIGREGELCLWRVAVPQHLWADFSPFSVLTWGKLKTSYQSVMSPSSGTTVKQPGCSGKTYLRKPPGHTIFSSCSLSFVPRQSLCPFTISPGTWLALTRDLGFTG